MLRVMVNINIILCVIFFKLIFHILMLNCIDFQNILGHLKSKTKEDTQCQAAIELIIRILPDRASEFVVVVDKNFGPIEKDTFTVSTIIFYLYIYF